MTEFFSEIPLTDVMWVCYLLYVALMGVFGFCVGYTISEEYQEDLRDVILDLENEIAQKDMQIKVLQQRPENRQEINIPFENW